MTTTTLHLITPIHFTTPVVPHHYPIIAILMMGDEQNHHIHTQVTTAPSTNSTPINTSSTSNPDPTSHGKVLPQYTTDAIGTHSDDIAPCVEVINMTVIGNSHNTIPTTSLSNYTPTIPNPRTITHHPSAHSPIDVNQTTPLYASIQPSLSQHNTTTQPKVLHVMTRPPRPLPSQAHLHIPTTHEIPTLRIPHLRNIIVVTMGEQC